MVKLEFSEKFIVEIEGEGVANWLTDYYSQIPTTDSGDSDLYLSTTPTSPMPEVQKGDPESHFGLVGDQFTIKRKRNFAMIDRDWSEITVSPGTSPWFVTPLIEYPLRRLMATEGFALLHASAAVVSDTTYVFPAWRHTGKTNTMLSLIKDGNGGFLSDDRVFVNADGTVLGFPLPINMYPYNYSALPELSPNSRSQNICKKLSERVDTVIDPNRSIIDKGIRYYNEKYLKPELNHLVYVEQLVPTVSHVVESTADEFVFLRTTPGRSSDSVEKTSFDDRKALADLVATNEGEWNSKLRRYCAMQDSLTPTENSLDTFHSFVTEEADILQNIVDNQTISKMNVPREENWTEKRVGEKIKAAVVNN